jgi:cell division transport system permease protein
MQKSGEKLATQSTRSSYLSTIVGITLVLFMLGVLGLVLLNARKLSTELRENIQLQVLLDASATSKDVSAVKTALLEKNYVRSTAYVSKETAAKELSESIGENFIDFLDFNPLSESFNISLIEDSTSASAIENIEKDLLTVNHIESINYNADLIRLVNQNVKKVTVILAGLSALLLLVSIALINNTIRLAIFSKRFLIRTMKLVGATHAFIRKPFIIKSFYQGLVSALLAFCLIMGLLVFLKNEMPGFFMQNDADSFIIIFMGVVGIGMLISYFATYFAVRKYIRLTTEKLY